MDFSIDAQIDYIESLKILTKGAFHDPKYIGRRLQILRKSLTSDEFNTYKNSLLRKYREAPQELLDEIEVNPERVEELFEGIEANLDHPDRISLTYIAQNLILVEGYRREIDRPREAEQTTQ
tara:strand:- start:94 stop:459 length:366 start_codon:yes stop_codon:yes gene_type:complete